MSGNFPAGQPSVRSISVEARFEYVFDAGHPLLDRVRVDVDHDRAGPELLHHPCEREGPVSARNSEISMIAVFRERAFPEVSKVRFRSFISRSITSSAFSSMPRGFATPSSHSFVASCPARLSRPAVRDAELLLHQVAEFLPPVVTPRGVQSTSRACRIRSTVHPPAMIALILTPIAERSRSISSMSQLNSVGDGPQRAPRILIVPFIFFCGGSISSMIELERILVPAPEVAAEPLAFQGKHPAADLLLGLAGDALDVVADDPGQQQERMTMRSGWYFAYASFTASGSFPSPP